MSEKCCLIKILQKIFKETIFSLAWNPETNFLQGLEFTVSVSKYSSHLKMEGKEAIISLAGTKKKKEYPLQFFCLPVWAGNSEEDPLVFSRKVCAFLCQHGRAVHAPPNRHPWISGAEEEICACAEPMRKEPYPVSSRASPRSDL